MNEQRRQEIIDKWFGGSAERYEQEMAELHARVVSESFGGDEESAEADHRAGRETAIYWQDIVNAATILPDLAEEVRSLIFGRLGYLPQDAVLLEHEPFLRSLLRNQQQGLLAEDDFAALADAQIKQLRNQDLTQRDWASIQDLTAEDYERYATEMPAYRHAARDRIVRFLGYEPDLLYTLEAELCLRRLLAYDDFHLGDTITQLDVEVLTIILYRETCGKDGLEAANAMPLLGGQATIGLVR